MTDKRKDLRPAKSGAVSAFLDKVATTPMMQNTAAQGRLIFAMDATASREHAWDQACRIQSDMFDETAALGGLQIQLCYYRGFAEFDASPWYQHAGALRERMASVSCIGGHTQIAQVLRHAIAETKHCKVNALVFVGDCMEENVDDLCHLAGELALLGVPIFVFHEGGEAVAARAFRQLARITVGAYCLFDAHSAQQLRELLGAVAVYAAGGHQALERFHRRIGRDVLRLSHASDTK